MLSNEMPGDRWLLALSITVILFASLLVWAQSGRAAPSTDVGDCYVISDADDHLGQINPATGEVTKVGYVDPPGGENLTVDPSTWVLYNVASEGGPTPFIIIAEQTAATTIINPDIGLWDVDALAFDPTDGTLYAVQSLYHHPNGYVPDPPHPGVLYTVDPTTGGTTHVVTLTWPSPDPLAGTTDPHVDGISFHPTTGVLYGAYSAYGEKSYLVNITVQTGALNLVGGVDGDPGYTGVDDIEDLSFAPDGTLYGVLGDQGAVGDDPSGSFEGLVTIAPTTAQATVVGSYVPGTPDPDWDVEAFACTVPLTRATFPVGGVTLPHDPLRAMVSWMVGLATLVATAVVAVALEKRRD